MSYKTYDKLGKNPNQPAPETMANIPLITSRYHRLNLIKNHRVVIIENFTTWCGPCKTVAPLFAQLALKYMKIKELQGHIAFVKEDVDNEYEDCPEIRGVPCFHFYGNGIHVPDLTVTGGNISTVEENLRKILGVK